MDETEQPTQHPEVPTTPPPEQVPVPPPEHPPGDDDPGDKRVHVQVWADTQQRDQHWLLNPVGHGYYMIINSLTRKALAVNGFSTSDGAAIVLLPRHKEFTNEQWRIDPSRTGKHQIVNRRSGKVLVVHANGTTVASGDPVRQGPASDDSASALWTVERVQL